MLRWVLCPVVESTWPDGTRVRVPKVSQMADPSRPPILSRLDDGTSVLVPRRVRFSTVISDGLPGQVNGWCLCLVRSADLTVLTADPEVIDALEGEDYDDGDNRLATTPRLRGWSGAKLTRVRTRLDARGIDTSGLSADTPLWQILRRVGRRVPPHFPGPAGTSVR